MSDNRASSQDGKTAAYASVPTTTGFPVDAEWDAAIESLYDSVGSAERLASVLSDLRSHFGARGVLHVSTSDSRHPDTFHVGAVGVDEQSIVEYHTHFNQYDEWAIAAARRPDFGPGATYRGTDLVPFKKLEQGYFWKAFLSRYGVKDILSTVIEVSSSDGPSTFLTFHRHVDQLPFEAETVPLLRSLAPHLRRVLRLHRRLAPSLALGATLYELIAAVETPILFLDVDGRVLDQNSAANQSLDGRHRWLNVRAGRLLARDGDRWMELGPRLADMATSRKPALEIALIDTQGRTAELIVRRVHGALTDRFADHPVIGVCMLRAGPPDRVQVLRRLYALTLSEARVVDRLANGKDVNEIADSLGVSVATVRSHLRSAMQKTQLNRQAKLVALALQIDRA